MAGALPATQRRTDASNTKTSARNHCTGAVAAFREGAVNDEVGLAIAGGHRIAGATFATDLPSQQLAVVGQVAQPKT